MSNRRWVWSDSRAARLHGVRDGRRAAAVALYRRSAGNRAPTDADCGLRPPCGSVREIPKMGNRAATGQRDGKRRAPLGHFSAALSAASHDDMAPGTPFTRGKACGKRKRLAASSAWPQPHVKERLGHARERFPFAPFHRSTSRPIRPKASRSAMLAPTPGHRECSGRRLR